MPLNLGELSWQLGGFLSQLHATHYSRYGKLSPRTHLATFSSRSLSSVSPWMASLSGEDFKQLHPGESDGLMAVDSLWLTQVVHGYFACEPVFSFPGLFTFGLHFLHTLAFSSCILLCSVIAVWSTGRDRGKMNPSWTNCLRHSQSRTPNLGSAPRPVRPVRGILYILI